MSLLDAILSFSMSSNEFDSLYEADDDSLLLGEESPLQPRNLETEWSDDQSSMSPRRLEWDLTGEVLHKNGLGKAEGNDLSGVSIVVKTDDDDDSSNISVMTPETKVSLKFILDPYELEPAVKSVCSSKPKSKFQLKQANFALLDRDHLPLCMEMNQTVSCPCVRMSHYSSGDYQDDIRKLYLMICSEGDSLLGDDFLASMIIESKQAGCNILSDNLSFVVPGFMDEGECQRFTICRAQFCHLFGLEKTALTQLESLRNQHKHRINPFGWSQYLLSYKIGKKSYRVQFNSP